MTSSSHPVYSICLSYFYERDSGVNSRVKWPISNVRRCYFEYGETCKCFFTERKLEKFYHYCLSCLLLLLILLSLCFFFSLSLRQKLKISFGSFPKNTKLYYALSRYKASLHVHIYSCSDKESIKKIVVKLRHCSHCLTDASRRRGKTRPRSFRPFRHLNFQDRNHLSLRLPHFFFCELMLFRRQLLLNTAELAKFDTFDFSIFF